MEPLVQLPWGQRGKVHEHFSQPLHPLVGSTSHNTRGAEDLRYAALGKPESAGPQGKVPVHRP